ncbi:uncharacterized protein TRIADDRAFT_59608 [Trichoplax adhaerens]|uniref:Death domain-containing protein n=1 Tax=Trichoplax adhaerens TaxID=10228 RepID=B3S5G6_TRIAD|nr:predicted protein [Trichoplax adhaerens]EDV22038.1 predicted protein [Trichoplax adhaerens]|eukprot:XP_002115675.1 predicted protein [Trichoplax adhaerens]
MKLLYIFMTYEVATLNLAFHYLMSVHLTDRSTFHIIANKIGSDWSRLLSELSQLSEIKISDQGFSNDQVISCLIAWYNKNGGEIAIDMIIEKLLAIDRYDIVHLIGYRRRNHSSFLGYILRSLPPISNDQYILRVDTTCDICNILQKIHQQGGHLIVHGRSGSDEMERSNALFVFDDLWDESYYQYLTFANQSVTTSRFNISENNLTVIRIEAPAILTDHEAIDLLSKHGSFQDLEIKLENLLFAVVDKSEKNPFILDLMGALLRQNSEICDNLISETHGIDNIYNNTYGAKEIINLSIQQLDDNQRQRFRCLGVFRPVQITISSVAAIWKCSQDEAIHLLQYFHQRRLVKYLKLKATIYLHDLVIDYLQKPEDSSEVSEYYSRELNRKLIGGYKWQCEGNWHLIQNDNYYHQYLVYDAIHAEADELLDTLFRDFNWIAAHVNEVKSLHYLDFSLQEYIHYLVRKRQSTTNIQELLYLFRRYDGILDWASLDVVQFLLNCSRKGSWIANRATELARTNIKINKGAYYSIIAYTSENIEESSFKTSKHFGLYESDVLPRCCKSRKNNFRIVGISQQFENCNIIVKAYINDSKDQQFKEVFRLDLGNRLISEVRISPDGQLVAYGIYRSHDILEWKVLNIDSQCPVKFAINSSQISRTVDSIICHTLEFCPELDSNPLLVACKDKEIVIWNLNHVESQKELKVYPYMSVKADCSRDESNQQLSCDYCLTCIKYINQNPSIFVLAYEVFNLHDSVINNHGKLILRFVNETNKELLHQRFSERLQDIAISDDHERIAIGMSSEGQDPSTLAGKVVIYKVDSRRIVPYLMAETVEYFMGLVFTSPSHLLYFTSSESYRQSAIGIGLSNDMQWQNVTNGPQSESSYTEDNLKVIDCSCTFCSEKPVASLFFHNEEKSYFLLKIWEGMNLQQSLEYMMDQKIASQLCFIFGEYEQTILVGYSSRILFYEPFGRLYYIEIQSTKVYLKSLNCDLDKIEVLFSRYREEENTVILVLRVLYKVEQLIIIRVGDFGNEQEIFYGENTLSGKIDIIYCDGDNLITRQYMEEGVRQYKIQWFTLGQDCTSIKSPYSHTLDSSMERIVCKMTVPIHPSSELTFIAKSLDCSRWDDAIETWGEANAHILAMYASIDAKELFLIVRGKQTVLLDHRLRVLMKGYEKNMQRLPFRPYLQDIDSLWSSDYFIALDRWKSIIYFYDRFAMKLLNVIHIPYYQPWKVCFNPQQCLLICCQQSQYNNCLIQSINLMASSQDEYYGL